MLTSTSSFTSIPHEIISNLHYSRRLLLHTPILHSPATTLAPSPNDLLSSTSSNHGNHNDSFDKNVVIILAALICAVICSLFINSLIKCVLKCSSMFNRESNYYFNMVSDEKLSTGVDKRVLKTFPVVKYSSEETIQGLGTECVICLSEFTEGEKVRILPKCNHGFHIKCIDKWLSSHSSCPTCRQSLVGTTSQKVIPCNNRDHQASTTSAAAAVSVEVITEDMIAISIVPLKRENMVRNYREHLGQS